MNLTNLQKELAELRPTIAACRETIDRLNATVREMTVAALRDEAVKRGELAR